MAESLSLQYIFQAVSQEDVHMNRQLMAATILAAMLGADTLRAAKQFLRGACQER